jgi:hypothetical protein
VGGTEGRVSVASDFCLTAKNGRRQGPFVSKYCPLVCRARTDHRPLASVPLPCPPSAARHHRVPHVCHVCCPPEFNSLAAEYAKTGKKSLWLFACTFTSGAIHSVSYGEPNRYRLDH